MKNKLNFYTKLIWSILDSCCTYVITIKNSDIKLISFCGNKPFDLDTLKSIVNNFEPTKKSFSFIDIKEFKNKIENENFNSKNLDSIGYLSILDENKITIGYLITTFNKPFNILKNQEKTVSLLSNKISEKLRKNKSTATKDLKVSASTNFNLNLTKEILKKTFKFSNDVFCIINKDQKFEFVSNASYNVWGYTPEEMIGTHFENYILEEDILESLEKDNQIKINAEISLFENRYIHKNGAIKNMLWSANWDEEFDLSYCIGKDVSDFKEIIKKSKENENLLLEAQKLTQMGSWNFEVKNDKVTWSDSLYKVFGVNKEFFLETHGSFIDLIIPEDREFVLQTSKNAQETGKPFNVVYRIKTPSGEQRFVEEFGYCEKDATGKIKRLFGTAQDVTERKKNELLLQDSNTKYKYLFDNNPLPLFLFDFETLKIIDCNIESLILYGYTKEEFLQLTIKDIRPEEDIEKIIEATKNESTYGEIHKKVWRHLKKNGELMYVEVTGHLLDYNNRRCSLALINDITANVELEKKQKEHVQFIETTLENLPIGIAVNKINDGAATLMNKQFHEIYGWPKEDLTDVATFFEKVYPDVEYREKIVNQVISDMSSKDPERMNWEGITITTQDGTKRIINAKNIPIYDQNLMISTVVDVTEKFTIQKSLLESNERFNYVTKATSDAIWDWDYENNLVYRAEGFKTIFGFDMEELNLAKTNWVNYIHPDDRHSATKSIHDKINSSGNYWKHDYRIIKPNGKVAFVQDCAYIIRGENNNVTRIIGAIQDVTQRKKEEQQLKLFASVATNTNDSVLITEAEPFDEPGPRIIYVNDAFTKMTGYTSEELIGKTPRIFQGPKSDKIELARLRKALQNWESYETTIINYKKNGEEFWINFSISPVANEKGWFTHWIALERDVTTRKNEELQNELIADINTVFIEPLKLHETLDRTLRYIAKFGDFCFAEAWLTSTDQNILNKISSNATTENMILFLEETKSIDTFIYGESFPGNVFKNKEIIIWEDLANQKLFVRRDAALKYGLKTLIGLPLLYNNEVIGVLAFGLDHEVINTAKYKTLLKKVGDYLSPEIKRKQLELELNQMFNFAPDLIVIIGLDGCFKRVNPATCQLLGYTKEELYAEPYVHFIHPQDREQSTNEITRLLQTNLTYYFENRYITKSGKIKWLAWNAIYVTEDNNIYAVAKDITEKRELENLLKKVNELARIGVWEVDLQNNTIFWSDITREIHEVAPDYIPDLETSISFYKEGSNRTKIAEYVQEAIHTGKPYDDEFQIVTAKGNEKWVRAIGEAESVNGNNIRIYGSFQDIDERKKAEIKLIENENYLRTILDNEPECVKVLNSKGELLSMNPAGLAMIEADNEQQVLGHHMTDLVNKDYQVGFNRLTKEVFKDNSGTFEFEVTGLKGSRRWLETHAVPLKDANGKIVNLLGVTRDITERKKAEEKFSKAADALQKALNDTNKIMDSSLDMICVVDKDGYFVKVSAACETILGYKPEELIGKPLINYVYNIDNEKTQMTANVVMSGKTIKNFENRYIRKDGSLVPIEWSARWDENDKLRYGVARDITDRKKAEEALKNTEERRKLIMNSALDAIICIDKDGIITFWNPQAEQIFGWSENEVMGKVLSAIIIPEHFRSMHDNGMKNYLKTGKGPALNVLLQLSAVRRNGIEFPIELTVLPIGQDGEEFFCAFIRDITERKTHEDQLLKLNKDLNKQKAELITSNKELEQFAYVASHDLQEPLRMVTSFLTLIEKRYNHALDEKGLKYINFAVEGAKNMRQIILDILEFSRINNHEENYELIDLKDIIKDISLLQGKLIKEKKAKIIFDELPKVYSIRHYLIQLFQNIISNALKYSKEDIPLQIIINSKEYNDYYQISINDNGIGIEEEYFEKIFIIFQRLHGKNQYQGNGMGLAIAKKIVDKLNGEIWVKSKAGIGSTFYINIPKK